MGEGRVIVSSEVIGQYINEIPDYSPLPYGGTGSSRIFTLSVYVDLLPCPWMFGTTWLMGLAKTGMRTLKPGSSTHPTPCNQKMWPLKPWKKISCGGETVLLFPVLPYLMPKKRKEFRIPTVPSDGGRWTFSRILVSYSTLLVQILGGAVSI